MVEPATASEVLANLRIQEADTRRDTNEAKEKLAKLAERSRKDIAEAEWVRKERDNLLQATTGLRMECDLARQEFADA